MIKKHILWENYCISKGCVFLLGQGPVFEVEFFVDPKNGTKKTNKPPAMPVCSQIALALSKKPPVV